MKKDFRGRAAAVNFTPSFSSEWIAYQDDKNSIPMIFPFKKWAMSLIIIAFKEVKLAEVYTFVYFQFNGACENFW